MQNLLCDDLWDELRRLSRKSKRRLAAVAFLSDADLVKFRKGDLLIVDASDGRIKCGDTSAEALASIFKKKTAVFSLPNLHAKVFVFDNTAIIGSANVSRNSTQNLIEAAVVTEDRATVSQASALIESLKEKATEIDSVFIERISKLEVQLRKEAVSFKNPKVTIGKLGKNAWILGVHELGENAFPKETKQAEEGEKLAALKISNRVDDVTWIRYTDKKSSLIKTAAVGDSVIRVWMPLNKKLSSVQVFAAAPVLRIQSEPTCTRFYIEETNRLRKTALSLNIFRKLAKTAGVTGKLGTTSKRCLTEDQARIINILWSDARKNK
jgi:hypothetical protein